MSFGAKPTPGHGDGWNRGNRIGTHKASPGHSPEALGLVQGRTGPSEGRLSTESALCWRHKDAKAVLRFGSQGPEAIDLQSSVTRENLG